MLFGWKKRIVRLHTIVLSGAPLHEIDPGLARGLEAMRGALRGTMSRDDLERDLAIFMQPTKDGPARHIWEPVDLYGWELAATLYLQDGKPWWVARASHKKDEPSDKEMSMIRTAVDCLGADPDRDCLMNVSFGGGHGYGLWWTWINQAPLLEIHIAGKGKDAQLQIVREGSHVKPGWERLDRNRIERVSSAT